MDKTSEQQTIENRPSQEASQIAPSDMANITKPDKKPEKILDLSKPTSGEKKYSWLKFGVAEVSILAATAGLAYVARYGRDSYGGVRNVLKDMQNGVEKWLAPDKRKTRIGQLLAGGLASMSVTMWGGHFFAPAMKSFESNKSKIVNYFNKKSDKPDELEIGKQRLADEPKQSWVDIIKGRIVSMSVVAVGFFGIAYSLKDDKETGKSKLDLIEDWGGVKLSKLTKEGKKIAELPIIERLENNAATNRSYKLGRMLALDVVATTISIIIWNVIGTLSAKKRHDKTADKSNADPNTTPSDTSAILAPDSIDSANINDTPQIKHTEKAPRMNDDYTSAIAQQKIDQELEPLANR